MWLLALVGLGISFGGLATLFLYSLVTIAVSLLLLGSNLMSLSFTFLLLSGELPRVRVKRPLVKTAALLFVISIFLVLSQSLFADFDPVWFASFSLLSLGAACIIFAAKKTSDLTS